MLTLCPDYVHQTLLGRGIRQQPPTVEMRAEEIVQTLAIEDENSYIHLPLPDWVGHHDDVMAASTAYSGADIDGWCRQLAQSADCPLPSIHLAPGWHFWADVKWVPSQPPHSVIAVVDAETVEWGGYWHPVCMVLRSLTGWHLWVADITKIGEGQGDRLVPFGGNNLLVGHNVCYDRQYMDTEYPQADSGNRFLDTMGMHVLVAGMGNQQRGAYKAMRKQGAGLPWTEDTATNGLDEVYKLYTGGALDKGVRAELVSGGYKWLMEPSSLERLVYYCIHDVQATWEVFRALYPRYRSHVPDEAQFVGQVLLGSTWIPLSSERFPTYYNKAECCYQESLLEIRDDLVVCLKRIADVWFPRFLEDPEGTLGELPPQLSQLDWTPAKSGKTKGLPAWYRKLKAEDLSLGSKIAPVLLGLTYKGKPMLFRPFKKSWEWYTEAYGTIAHPDGEDHMSNPFIKGNVKLFEAGVFTSAYGYDGLVQRYVSGLNWQSVRKRVKAMHVEAPEGFPVHIPQTVATGTITGRAVESLFHVAPNSKGSRIGTEIKSMIEAPPGHVIVGADIDGQELWLAACLADMHKSGCVGTTPLSLMFYAGSKEQSTDLMSVTAQQVGVSRQAVKGWVYGGIYGLGFGGLLNAVNTSFPDGSDNEAIASRFLSSFKGQRGHSGWVGGTASEAFNGMSAIADSRRPTTPVTGKAITVILQGGNQGYKTTRDNWVIQASGADMRDLWVCLLRYVFHRLDVDARLITTLHDEVRYVVPEPQAITAAYGFQLAHLILRAHMIARMGLDNIPAGIAFHSAVDIDRVWRKSPDDPCVTPSQPEALEPGCTLTASELLDKLSLLQTA